MHPTLSAKKKRPPSGGFFILMKWAGSTENPLGSTDRQAMVPLYFRIPTLERFPVAENEPAARQYTGDERGFPMMGIHPESGADAGANQNIALPMAMHLHACDGVVGRQKCQSIHPGMIAAVFRNERGHHRGDFGNLATWKALMALAREKTVRVGVFAGSLSREPIFHQGSRACRKCHR